MPRIKGAYDSSIFCFSWNKLEPMYFEILNTYGWCLYDDLQKGFVFDEYILYKYDQWFFRFSRIAIIFFNTEIWNKGSCLQSGFVSFISAQSLQDQAPKRILPLLSSKNVLCSYLLFFPKLKKIPFSMLIFFFFLFLSQPKKRMINYYYLKRRN